MPPTPVSRPSLRFGAFEIRFEAGELRKEGVQVRLQEQPFLLLAKLLEHPGRVVTRGELRHAIWPEDTFVDFNTSLNVTVLKARQALGDPANHPHFIETIPRRGYRFMAPVEPIVPEPVAKNESVLAASSCSSDRIFALRRSNILLLVCILATSIPASWLWLTLFDRSEPSRPTWSIKPMTRFAGQETSPSWSPDGSFIAFTRTSLDHANVFTMPVGGGDPVQLTHGEDDLTPRWSPTGRHIAYLGNEGGTKKVFLIPPLGGTPRILAETNIPYQERFVELSGSLGAHPWSPHGQELAFSRLQPDGRIALWKVNQNTKHQTRLTWPPVDCDDLLASSSFDGNWIAFTRRRNGFGSLWLVPAGGGEPRSLLSDSYDNNGPAWSPDNRRLIFESNRAGPENLWEVDITSRQLHQITVGAGADVHPAMGPQNGLLYVRYSQNLSLYLIDINTGQEERLTSNTGRNYWPRFSPDARRIVYQSDQTGNWELWMSDLNTKTEIPLTHHPAVDIAPEWSPDGRHISFLSNRDGPFQLWMLDVENGTSDRLVTVEVLAPATISSGFSGHTPTHRWSPDGRKIGFLTRGEKDAVLWSVDPDGRNLHRVLSEVVAFGWYRDSKHVVCTRAAASGFNVRELAVVDLDKGQDQVLYRGAQMDLMATSDGSAVLFSDGPSHFQRGLFTLRLDRPAYGLPRPVGKANRLTSASGLRHVHEGGWSLHGKKIVCGRDLTEADIYLIENYR